MSATRDYGTMPTNGTVSTNGTTPKCTRPVVRYHGGKWKLALWIISHFPEHRIYTESYGGGASVLLRKTPCYAEVYNDLSGEMVNVFRVLRDNGPELIRRIELTPFSRHEYVRAYDPTNDPVEWARRVIARSFMGFGSGSVYLRNSGFRSNSSRSGTTPAHDWANLPPALRQIVERLRSVVIEERDAILCMQDHDSPTSLHYVDPPYVHDTRGATNRRIYSHEMTNADHERMCVALKELEGAVVLSGYDNEIYNDILGGWSKVTRKHHADGARDRVECLWRNDRATHGIRRLF